MRMKSVVTDHTDLQRMVRFNRALAGNRADNRNLESIDELEEFGLCHRAIDASARNQQRSFCLRQQGHQFPQRIRWCDRPNRRKHFALFLYVQGNLAKINFGLQHVFRNDHVNGARLAGCRNTERPTNDFRNFLG